MVDEEAENPWSSLAAGMQAARQQLQLARRRRDSSDVRYSRYSNTFFVARNSNTRNSMFRVSYCLPRLFITLVIFVTLRFAPVPVPYLLPEDGVANLEFAI